MVKHRDIWAALDALAEQHGLSTSGLAKKAGLDSTSFNKSKRSSPNAKLRWPSMESIAKVLEATGTSMSEFTRVIEGEDLRQLGNDSQAASAAVKQRIPIIGAAQAGNEGFFDDAGFPVGGSWDEVDVPNLGDPQMYALEVSGDSMKPAYRDGDIIVVSPNSGYRRGDRVVVKSTSGEVMAKELARQTANRLELKSLNPDFEDRSFDMAEIAWIARIVWVSQ